MQPLFELNPPHKFVPDFYFLAQHGVGNVSLAYYLTWCGVIPTKAGGIVVPQKDNIAFLVSKCTQIYRYGLNIDVLPKQGEKIVKSCNDGAIIWLVRDPVLALTSNLNWYIGQIAFSKGDLSLLSSESISNHIKYLFYNSNLFDSIRHAIPSDNSALIIQTEDISGDKCIETLKRIALFLNVPYNSEVENIATIPFNSYPNRLWSYQPMKYYPINGYNVCYFNIAPCKLFDFWFNHWTSSYILGSFEYKNEEYTVGLPIESIDVYAKNFLDSIWNNIDIESLKIWIDIWKEHCTVTLRIYNRLAFTPEKLIAFFRSNKSLYSWYLTQLNKEIKTFEKHNPQIVDSWKYYKQLTMM